MDFLDLRRLFGPSTDLRDPKQRWKYEKKLRAAQRRRAERQAALSNLLPYPFTRQAD
jgi:hypothetical protein